MKTSEPSAPRTMTVTAIAAALLLVTGCGRGNEERSAAVSAAEREALALVESRVDSAEAILEEQIGLTADLRSALRKHLNKRQVATARELGVPPVKDSSAIPPLVRQGKLVRLEDSTDYWIVRDLDYSVPYVTPDARAMLAELGQEFHERLDSLGLPPFRFEITSVLRTHAMQARLRRGNANASRTTSSHEFGTTVDIAYSRFAPPAEIRGFAPESLPDSLPLRPDERREIAERAETHARQQLAELGEERAAALKGILGAVLASMQEEKKVQPLIERSQPIYHMTVAARYPAGEPARAE